MYYEGRFASGFPVLQEARQRLPLGQISSVLRRSLLETHGGAIALQAHDAASTFYFRSVRIRPLDQSATL
jgi:hypothetical protein